MGAPEFGPVRPRELALLVGGLVLIFAGQLLAADAVCLFTRHFWIDEIFTHTLVTDADPVHALHALAGGVDMNPPTLYLLLRGFTLLTGPSETAFRAFAALSVLLALVGLYLLLRRVFPPLVAFTAVLVVGCHPLILTHAFEARFYGPWLAAIIWFAVALAWFRTAEKRLWPGLLLAVCAVHVCTIHYFGILTLGLVTLFDLAAHRATLPSWRVVLLVVSLGPLALLACAPLYFRQEASLTVPTWVGAANPQAAGEFLISIFRPVYLGLVVVAWLLSQVCQWGRITSSPPQARSSAWPTLAGLSSLVLLPVILIAFSYAVLPVLVDRYALTALAGVLPLLAYLLARTDRFWLIVLSAALVIVGALELSQQGEQARQSDRRTEELAQSIRGRLPEVAVLFESPHDLYVVCRYAPDVAGRCYFLDFEPADLRVVNPMQIILRDVARRYAAHYGKPAVLAWAEAKGRSPGLLVPGDPRFFRSKDRYPGCGVYAIGGGLSELRKQE